MHKIVKAQPKDAKLLSKIGAESFLTAHGHSAPKKDIDNYVTHNFNENTFKSDVLDDNNLYYLIYYNNKIAGYSKIIFNKANKNIPAQNITNLSRLYLLEEFYNLGLGKILFDFNLQLCKKNNQIGIWLAVWVENQKAIKFYNKVGFNKVGDYNFKISERHSNPNHIMYLEF